MNKSCAVCDKPLWSGNATGLCRTHFNATANRNPELNRKRAASLSRFAKANPDKVHASARKGTATKLANPEYVEKLRERMRTVIQPKSYTPEAVARRDMRARGLKAVERWVAWCPEEYRPIYRELRQVHQLTFAEAKAATLNHIARDKAKEAQLSPFERQERALRLGAALQDNQRIDRHSDSAAELRRKLA